MGCRKVLFVLILGVLLSFGVVHGYKNDPLADFYVDAPWRVESGSTIPIILEIHDANETSDSYFYDIEVYDQNSGGIVTTLSPSDLGLPIKGICLGTGYTAPQTHLWYHMLYLDPTTLTSDANGDKKIKVVFDRVGCVFWDDVVRYLTIHTENSPKFSNWYCGDTHYHSSYTDTWYSFQYGEEGAPIAATQSVADSIGMDWFFVTDHSNAFGGHDDIYYNKSWTDFKNECNSYSKCLIGEEINCNYRDPLTWGWRGNHYLGYNLSQSIDDKFYNNVPTSSNPTCEQVIQSVSNQGGFGYAAHPASSSAINNEWDDYSLPKGLEIWNGDIADGRWRTDLDEGLSKWETRLLNELLDTNGKKVFISAGSDAHGEFQSSFGKAMTCCYAPLYSKDNIYTALKNGNCYLTNNGALKVEVQASGGNYKIGETAQACTGSSVTIKIDYSVVDECDLTVLRGIVGADSESSVTSSHISGSGQLSFAYTPYDNSYYRLECIDSTGTKRLYTNPIWLGVNNCQTKCVDDTPYGQCNLSMKPKYCDNGNLVNRCGTCGCPSGATCQADGSCTTTTCDSSSYLSCPTAYFMTSGETKSNMCVNTGNNFQYYKISTPVNQKCYVTWTVTPTSGSDYDLYAAWGQTCDQGSSYKCASDHTGSTIEVCESPSKLFPETYSYARVRKYEFSGLGSYSINAALSECESICSDGTTYGQCSTSKPLYCSSGRLVDDCSACGCPFDKPSCVSGSCGCASGWTGNYQCSADLRQGEYQYFNCTQGWRTIEDCNSHDNYTGSPYCAGNDVRQKYRNYSCSASANECVYEESDRFVETCTDGCANGTCMAPPPEEGYVAVYHFDEGSGSIAHDSSGHGYNGTLIGCSWNSQSESKNGTSSLSFISINDKVELPLDALSSMPVGAIDVWIYPTELHENSYFISEELKGSANYFGLLLDTSGRITYRIYNGSDFQSNRTVPLNNWTHVAVTWNGFERRIYINGVQDAVASGAGSIPDVHYENTRFYLGSQVTSSSNRFIGRIDDLRISNSTKAFQHLPGDVNGDCKVNIFDLAAVGLCFGKTATGSCVAADVKQDGLINIFDLATVGINFGRSC
ncbi:MAG: CehA/McbA family metallohydrolase [Candidatus Aenigmarchaeota archaeon]|nr:CehA/McbA family metallohydrolase [Candidatus Aenigmarchaeota archaeon]